MPIVRTFISLPAGIGRMNFKKFVFYTFMGSLPWSLLLTYVGLKLGQNWKAIEPLYHKLDIVVALGLVALAPLQADFGQIEALLADSTGVYVVDSADPKDAVFRINGGRVTRFAGGGLASSGSITKPSAVVYSHANGKIYVSDAGRQSRLDAAVWEIDPNTFEIRSVAGNPPGTTSDNIVVDGPKGVAADSLGNVYFCNTLKHSVCQVDFADPHPIAIAGTGTNGLNLSQIDARLVQLTEPTSVRVFEETIGGNHRITLYFYDKGNKRVCKLVPDTSPAVPRTNGQPNQWIISSVVGGGQQAIFDGANASRASIGDVGDIDVDKYGNLYVSEANKIWRIDRAGMARLIYPRSGSGVGAFDSISVNISDDGVLEIYFTVPGSQKVRKLYI
jgi:DNA-binding beta-propeller fold protein YncE